MRSFADRLARRAIDHDRHDVLERPAVLTNQIWIAQADEQKREGERPEPRAARSPQNEHDRGDERQQPQRVKRPKGQQRSEGDRPDGHRVSLSMMSLAWT